MTTLSYRDYQGAVEYEDGQLVIQLLHIDDFISTTCTSAAEAESAFYELVDDYLATCEETGRPPDKPFKGSLNIRMQPSLHRRLAMAATAAGISLNAWIVRACEEAMSAPSQSPGGTSAKAEAILGSGHAKHSGVLAKSIYGNIIGFEEFKQINRRRSRESGECDGQKRVG